MIFSSCSHGTATAIRQKYSNEMESISRIDCCEVNNHPEIDLQVGEVVAAEELEHGEGGRRRHGGRGQQQAAAAARAGRERRLVQEPSRGGGGAGAGGGEERAQLAQPRQAARVERHRREQPRGGRRRQRRGGEDPRAARGRRAEHRGEAVHLRRSGEGQEEVVVVVGVGGGAVVGSDVVRRRVVVRRQRADGPLDGGQPRGRGQRGGGREEELPRLELHRRRLRLRRRRRGGRPCRSRGGVELGLGDGARAGEPLDERHEVPRLGVDHLGRGVVDDDRLPLLLLLLLVLVLVLLLMRMRGRLLVLVPLRRDGRLPDLVRVLADGEPRRTRALELLPAPRRRAVAGRRVHVRTGVRSRRPAAEGSWMRRRRAGARCRTPYGAL